MPRQLTSPRRPQASAPDIVEQQVGDVTLLSPDDSSVDTLLGYKLRGLGADGKTVEVEYREVIEPDMPAPLVAAIGALVTQIRLHAESEGILGAGTDS